MPFIDTGPWHEQGLRYVAHTACCKKHCIFKSKGRVYPRPYQTAAVNAVGVPCQFM